MWLLYIFLVKVLSVQNHHLLLDVQKFWLDHKIQCN